MAANPRAVAKALLGGQFTPNNTSIGNGGFGGFPSPTSSGVPMSVGDFSAWTAGRAQGNALPRDWWTFLSGSMGPLAPIPPIGLDAPPPGSDRPEPRRTQMPVGWNMPMGPPGSEGLSLCTFPQLRTVSQTYSVARACIDLRKQELVGLEWDIVPTKAAEKKMRAHHGDRKDWDERRAKVMRFMRQPDPNYFNFASWFSAQLEDILAIDAWTLYLHPSKRPGKGVMGSNLAALDVIDGATIRPLVDIRGGRPLPPNPCFQQYLFGVPRTDLMTLASGADVADMQDALVGEYRGDQLLYLPYDTMDWTPYGFPCVAKAIVPILSGLNRQQYQLEYFSEGSVPSIFISAGDPNMTPSQVRELQDALNAMAGDVAWKHKIIVLPGGSKIDPMRPTELSGPFDEMVMTQVCMAFGVMPMELGLTPRSSTSGHSGGAANQMGKMSTDAMNRKANKPLLFRVASVLDHILQIVLKQDDMRFLFEGFEGVEDEGKQVDLQVNKISHGLMSIDEARIANGEQPWGVPITSDPVLILPTGIVPIKGLDPETGQLPPQLQPPMPGQPGVAPEPGQPGQPGVEQKPALPASGSSSGSSTPAHAGAQAHDQVMGQQTGKFVSPDLVKGHPYPGQRYRHGWVPVEGGGVATAVRAVDQFAAAHPEVKLVGDGPNRHRVVGVEARGWRRGSAVQRLTEAADADGATLTWHDPAFSKGDRHTALMHGFRAEDGASHDTATTLVRAPGSHGYPPAPEPAHQPITFTDSKGARKSAAEILGDYEDTHDRGEVEQAMADVMNGTHGGLTVRTLGGSTVTDDGSVSVAAHIFDSENNQVGEVRRLIGRDADGNLFAEHVLLQLDENQRGQRFAEEFNAHLEDWYRQSGIGRIETHADIDVGGYAWSRAGYDFRDGYVPQDVQRRIRAEINSGDLTAGEERELVDILSRATAGHSVSAYEVSQAGRRVGDVGRGATWPGKRIMLGSDWQGVKWL